MCKVETMIMPTAIMRIKGHRKRTDGHLALSDSFTDVMLLDLIALECLSLQGGGISG